MRLEDLQPQCTARGIHPDGVVTVVNVQWFGSEALELTYKTPDGAVANELLYRHDEERLLAVHTSVVEPLPHQITAVYEAMLPRQPLRFLLADDPGAGKTIMAGLLIKELVARGDLERCLIVCPGSLAEQWQDELYRRFQLPFEILTNDKLEAARTGNWFLETDLVIARLDKLSRNEDVQQKLQAPEADWDLVVCDEAHKLSAAFVCPGHPLLDAVIDLILERHRDLLKRGAVLVDERDAGTAPRVLFSIEHAIQDGSVTRTGERRVISKRVLYVELGADGEPRHLHYAPYLDYRALAEGEPTVGAILERTECAWLDRDLEQKAQAYAVAHVVPEHLREVRDARLALIAKTEAAVKDRLTKEIAFWDHRAEQLKLDEEAGRSGARLNSGEARRRADTLQLRLQKRLAELKRDARISPRPPVVLGGLLVVPRGLIDALAGRPAPSGTVRPDTLKVAARARAIVMETERRLGFEPMDREFDKLGYDIESRVPATGTLRFIEVKGRRSDAETVTVTRNEILYSLNKPDDFILAIVEFRDDDTHRVHYVRQPFQREPDFDAASVNYTLKDLLARAEAPR